MGLRILIVDDESLARTRLRTLLADCKTPPIDYVATAENAVEAMRQLQSSTIDVLLLDIHMPGMSGLELAQNLQSLPSPPAIIFVTAHTEHALTAFELDAADYLTKPVRLERLEQALQKAERSLNAAKIQEILPSQEALLIQDRGQTERVPLSEILYCKAELKYVTVHTAKRNYVLDDSLSELASRYSQWFMRIHRSTLVAKHAIRALQRHDDPLEGEGWAVRLDGVDEPLMVSRRQVSVVRDAIAKAAPIP